jgi:hypothetical protein
VHSHSFSWRAVAAAAAILVTVSAGITWNLARRGPAENAAATMAATTDPSGDTANVISPRIDELPPAVSPTDDGSLRDAPPSLMGAPLTQRAQRGVLASSPSPDGGESNAVAASTAARVFALDTLYGREIAMLRTVAETQLGLLDTATVQVVRRNLDIIDQAIMESRAALAGDPNSGFLLEQLDRAYERKVDLLRRLALL